MSAVCLLKSVTPALSLVTDQLSLLCFLWAVSLLPALFHSASLPSSIRFSTLPHPNTSVLPNKCPVVPYEVTLPGSVSSLGVLENHTSALKSLQNKSSYKSTDCGNINHLNRAHTAKAAREFILVMRWRDALRISQLGLWFMPPNEVML